MSSRLPLFALLSAALLLQGCGTQPVTTLEATWVAPQLPKEPFKQVLIVSMAHSDFVQVAFQDRMAAALKAKGVNAVASKAYFSSYTTNAEAQKARFRKSIADSGADFVLFARVVGTETKGRDERFMTFGDASGYYTGYDRYLSVARSASSEQSHKTITSEVSLFGVPGDKLIWSGRIRTANPEATTGAGYAPELVEVVLDAMKRDKLF